MNADHGSGGNAEIGVRGQIWCNALANAAAMRDWRIYAGFGQGLIGIARKR